LKHEKYNKYNQRLRAMLALVFWRRVMTGAGEQSETQALQQKLAMALKGDEWRKDLEISLAYMSGNDIDDKIALTAKNLPAHLKNLNLDLKGTDVGNDVLASLGTSVPRGLETLTLDVSSNPSIDNFGIETMVTKLPPHLSKLRMDLTGCSTTKEVDEKRNSLDELRQHIIDESEKGNWCSYVNLVPSATGRMVHSTLKFKH